MEKLSKKQKIYYYQDYAQTNRHKKILLIGSGPIVIGQAWGFDYFGSQACPALQGIAI